MTSNLHPSQLHQHLQMYTCAKWSYWCSLIVSLSLLSLGVGQKSGVKPWVLAASVGTLEVGRKHRQTAKLLQEVDDCPCELDLSNWGTGATASAPVSGRENEEVRSQSQAINEYEQFILHWGQQHPGEILKARILLQASRLFEGMQPDEVRIFFASMADRGLGEVEGSGDRLGWRWSKKCESSRTNYQQNYGYWECLDCGHTWAFDADDPDYDDESNECLMCLGSGFILSSLGKDDCTLCGGCGIA